MVPCLCKGDRDDTRAELKGERLLRAGHCARFFSGIIPLNSQMTYEIGAVVTLGANTLLSHYMQKAGVACRKWDCAETDIVCGLHTARCIPIKGPFVRMEFSPQTDLSPSS